MKQVSLKESNIERLSVTFWVNLTDDLLERIRTVVAPDGDGDYGFVDAYKMGNVNHRVVAILSKSGFVPGEYKIELFCEKKSGRKLAGGMPSVSKLFEIISSVEGETRAIGVLSLSFGRQKKSKPIISLPIKITDMPEALYDEIDGIHFVKREGKLVKYEVILDVEADKTLTEWLSFRMMVNINESILENAMREGLRIAGGFVSKGGQ